jgi:hypothetical protein
MNREMRRSLAVCSVAALAAAAAASAQPTTYTYTGDPYTTAGAPYAVGGNLQGTLSLASPLPPFFPLTDISPAIVSFSFSDDIETRTLADSFLCSFEVATDGLGAITQWRIGLRRKPFNPGDPHHAIDSFGGLEVVLNGLDTVGTGTAPADPCGVMVLSPFASTGSQGTWTSFGEVSVVEVPALGPLGLPALALVLAGFAVARLARNR